ncbi:hypothetical protein U1Q18_025147 [Sarracenia purpurea var. burkii]
MNHLIEDEVAAANAWEKLSRHHGRPKDDGVKRDSSVKANSGRDVGADNGSDSEDNLNIILNDDGGSVFPGDGLSNNRRRGDQSLLGDELELSPKCGGNRGNGSKGGYQSQYVRNKASYSFHVKENGLSFHQILIMVMGGVKENIFLNEEYPTGIMREPRTANRGRVLETISPRNGYDPRLTEGHGRHRRQFRTLPSV